MTDGSVPPEVYGPDDGDQCDGPTPAPSAESLTALLTLVLAGSATAGEIACKALLLAQAVRHPHAPRSIRGMARRMGCSVSEAHRRVTAFRLELDRIKRQFRNA